MLSEEYFEHWGLVRGGTLEAAKLVPDDQLAYTPHADMMSLGQLNFHIISACYFMARRWLKLAIDIPDAVKSKQPMNRSVFIRQLEVSDEMVRDAMKALNPRELVDEAYKDAGGKVWTKGYVVWHLGEHEVHHRAQLKMYLKLIGQDTSSLPF